MDDEFDVNETDSFDVTNHDVEPVIPIVERTMHEQLSETVFEYQEVTFTIIDTVSQKRSKVLVCSLSLLSLPFLPPAHIGSAFEKLAERASTPATTRLIEYMRGQWLTNSVFRVEDWSVYRQFIRTNNGVEGWHHRLNVKAGGCLGFYRLVPLLRQEAELVKIAVEDGDPERGHIKRFAKMDKAIENCWEKYTSGEWKTSVFLAKVGNLYSVRG